MNKNVSKREIEKIIYLYKVNSVIRYSQKRKEKFQTQSVAEHIANLTFLAYYFRDVEPFAKSLNFDKVIKIILLHDFGEVETGDTPTAFKKDNHINNELKAVKKIKKMMPSTFQDAVEIFNNYENLLDRESVFVKGLDAMDGLLFWQNENGVKMLRSEYNSHKQFLEKEKYVYEKKTNFFKNSELKVMAKYYECIYKQSELYKIIK